MDAYEIIVTTRLKHWVTYCRELHRALLYQNRTSVFGSVAKEGEICLRPNFAGVHVMKSYIAVT